MDCDETFNYVEPLHMMLYGRGLQTWEYSPEFSLRSYLFLLLHVIVAYIAKLVGVEAQFGKIGVYYFTRTAAACFSSICQAALVASVSRRFGRRTSNVFLVFLLFGAGMSHSAHAILPQGFTMNTLMLAFAAWLDTEPAELFARLIAAAAAKADVDTTKGNAESATDDAIRMVEESVVHEPELDMTLPATSLPTRMKSRSNRTSGADLHLPSSRAHADSTDGSQTPASAGLGASSSGPNAASSALTTPNALVTSAATLVIPAEGPLSAKSQTRRVETAYKRVVFWVAVSGLLGWPFVGLLVLPIVFDVMRAYIPCDMAFPCWCRSRMVKTTASSSPKNGNSNSPIAATSLLTDRSRTTRGSGSTPPTTSIDDNASLDTNSAIPTTTGIPALPPSPVGLAAPSLSLCAAAAIFPYPAALPQRLLPPIERIKSLARLALFAAFSAFAVLAPSILVDAVYYRKAPVVAVWNIAKYNSNPGGDEGDSSAGQQLYGTEPTSFYLINLLLNFNVAIPLTLLHLAFGLVACGSLICLPRCLAELFAEITCNVQIAPTNSNTTSSSGNITPPAPTDAAREAAGARAFARARNRILGQLVATSPLYAWLLVMTPQPHKEERFLYVIYPLIALSAAFGLELVMDIVQTVAEKLASCWGEKTRITSGNTQEKDKEREKDTTSYLSCSPSRAPGIWNFMESHLFALAPSPSRSSSRGRFAKLWGRAAWISVCLIALVYMMLSVSRSLALTYNYQAPTLAFMSLSAASYAQTNRAVDNFLEADPELRIEPSTANQRQDEKTNTSETPSIWPQPRSQGESMQPRRRLLGEGSTVSPTEGSLVVRSVNQLIALMNATNLRGVEPHGYPLATISQHLSPRIRSYIDYDPAQYLKRRTPEFVDVVKPAEKLSPQQRQALPPLSAHERMAAVAQSTILRACVGKDWYRFPSSFFLPEAQWIEVALDTKAVREYIQWWEADQKAYWRHQGGAEAGFIEPTAQHALQADTSPLPPPGFGQGVLVPMDSFATEISRQVLAGTNAAVQNSSTARGTFQILLRPRVDLDFIQSDFQGILPQHFSANVVEGISMATSTTPPFMNALNQREATRYVPVDSCHYVVDGDLGRDRTHSEDAWGSQLEGHSETLVTDDGVTDHKPLRAHTKDGSAWDLMFSVALVDPERSNRFTRAFYLPQKLSQNRYIPFNVWRKVPTYVTKP